jgi:hypothetical protein
MSGVQKPDATIHVLRLSATRSESVMIGVHDSYKMLLFSGIGL